MRRHSILITLALFAAAPAAAQPSIHPGETAAGELTTSDPRMKDGSRYDVWRFQAEPGHVYLVTLRSERFDAFLAVGPTVTGDCNACSTDDDGAGGTDAAVRFVPTAGRTYEIRANAYQREGAGAYELTLRDEGVADTAPAAPGVVQAGETVQGRLGPGDELQRGGYTDTYFYNGRAGETVVVTLRSADFDTVVAMGVPNHRGCRPIDSDDDGAGGTDSRLTFTLNQDGPYHIHVRTARTAGAGAYTLTVERQ
jgi:hypothetical protein